MALIDWFELLSFWQVFERKFDQITLCENTIFHLTENAEVGWCQIIYRYNTTIDKPKS